MNDKSDKYSPRDESVFLSRETGDSYRTDARPATGQSGAIGHRQAAKQKLYLLLECSALKIGAVAAGFAKRTNPIRPIHGFAKELACCVKREGMLLEKIALSFSEVRILCGEISR
jgi:hypothetical protein